MASEGRELFLIDGNSLAYRAFFALPETIATSKGEPTNAIFGFASMLVKILSEHGPVSTVVVWDAGMSGREQRYEPYKAQRKPKPDLLREQWPNFEPLVDAFGFHNIKVEGYEADDVIATLAGQAQDKGISVTIVTGDRDAYQLVDDGGGASVKVMTTTKGISQTKTYDSEAVLERYGVGPEQMVDLMALRGDTSDNIPGVPGIGEKTAAQLVSEFGSLEAVLANVDKVSGAKRKENLQQNADLARLSKELVTLKRDLDCDIDIEGVAAQKPDPSNVLEFFDRFELRELSRRLSQVIGADGKKARPQNEERAVRPEMAKDVGLPQLGRSLPEEGAALAVEGMEGGGLSWCAHTAQGKLMYGEAKDLPSLIEAWADRPLVTHDYKSVVRAAMAVGTVDVPMPQSFGHDTMVAAYLIEPLARSYKLEELADGPAEDGLAWRAQETWRLAARQREEMAGLGLERLFRDIELPLVGLLAEMEMIGVKLDTYRLGEINARVGEQLDELEHTIWELAGEQFTIGSPQQLSKLLFEKLGLTRKRRGKTGWSTDARVLRSIRHEHEIVGEVERWRELSKLKNTYLDALPNCISAQTGRLHTTFNQTATATGRLSSTEPNLQNIPVRTDLGREIRDCFVAEEGNCLIASDYSQVELRVLAQLAGDNALMQVFSDGADVHTTTAAEVFGINPQEVSGEQRSRAKAVNFGIIYGQSAHGLSEELGIPYDEAATYIERYLGRFPAVKKFIEGTVKQAQEEGFVATILGRRRPIPELRSSRHSTKLLGERLAVNTVIQGSAADIIKLAMIACRDRLKRSGLKTRLVLQIHDELLFEGPKGEAKKAGKLVLEEMESAYKLDPPLKADLGSGHSWLEAKG